MSEVGVEVAIEFGSVVVVGVELAVAEFGL